MAQRLPTVGGDDNTWGTVLNGFLKVSLVATGSYAGSLTLVSANQTSNYTIGSQSSITTGGETVLVNATSGTVTITLPDATAGSAYYIHSVKKIDSSANTVVINTTSSQTIDGSTSATIYIQYLSLTFVSDGSNWNVI